MYTDTETFSLKAIGNLRTSCEEVIEISDALPEVVLNSLELGFEFFVDLLNPLLVQMFHFVIFENS